MDEELINAAFLKKQNNIYLERNDFLLHQIHDFVTKKKWAVLRPDYQRREVWDDKKKSLFIESLLLNIPVPNIFLYEYELSRYEVMDGQQRLSSIIDFYENNFKLKGLSELEVLNGMSYDELPELVKRGLDRRRIQASVVLAQDADTNDTRILVFDRLNTGGVNLNSQEIRNCIYKGELNRLIGKLSANKILREALGIPSDNEEMIMNTSYRRMVDCETVLKFFAYRDDKFKGSSKATLDDFMMRNQNPDEAALADFESSFLECIETAKEIFEGQTFRHDGKFLKILFDGVMYGLFKNLANRRVLIEKKELIVNKVAEDLGNQEIYTRLLYKVGSIESIKHRLNYFDQLIKTTAL